MMMRRKKQRGMTLLEVLVALLVTSFVLITLGVLFALGVTAERDVYDEPAQADNASEPLNTVADHLRNAQNCTASNGCTGGVQGSVLAAASESDITYYSDGTNANGSPVRYHLVGSNLMRPVGATDIPVLQNISSLTFTYYKITTLAKGSATQVEYNSPTFSKTANENAPTAAELPNLAAIQITATSVRTGHQTVQYSTLVRLRNSPYRVNLQGN